MPGDAGFQNENPGYVSKPIEAVGGPGISAITNPACGSVFAESHGMRKTFVIALTFVIAAIGMPAGLFGAPPARPQITGGAQGVAKDERQQNLPGARVQVRASNGQLAASGTTNSTGAFSFTGLTPGSYTIELLDAAGNIVGTSAVFTVTSGGVATVTVTAAAAGAMAAAGSSGVGLFGLGTVGTVAVIGAAAAATIIAIQATKDDASPSR